MFNCFNHDDDDRLADLLSFCNTNNRVDSALKKRSNNANEAF